MAKTKAERLWDQFMLRVNVNAFGERAVIGEGKKSVNLLGSVEKHKRLFMEAWVELHLKDG